MSVNAELSERLVWPISTAELERRWGLIRSAMADAGIDVLVVQGQDDCYGGVAKYLTDLSPVARVSMTVVFPLDDEMTIVRHGPPGELAVAPEGDGVHRGVKRILSAGYFPAVGYSCRGELDGIQTALEPYLRARIGLAGVFAGPPGTSRELWRLLEGANVTDASDLVDRIKAVKSPEEQELIRGAAVAQDAALEAAFAALEPGKRDADVVAVARAVMQEHGSERGLYLAQSGPPGTVLIPSPRQLQNRVIQEGDVFTLLIEGDGAGGFFTHISRTAVLGSAPQEMLEEFEFVRRAQQYTIDLVQPGADPAEIFAAYNAFMREHGRPEERRLHCHGQGYDVLERPMIRDDETLPIEAGMNIGCHPGYVGPTGLNWITDNWLIGVNGGNERIHRAPQVITEIDV